MRKQFTSLDQLQDLRAICKGKSKGCKGGFEKKLFYHNDLKHKVAETSKYPISNVDKF